MVRNNWKSFVCLFFPFLISTETELNIRFHQIAVTDCFWDQYYTWEVEDK